MLTKEELAEAASLIKDGKTAALWVWLNQKPTKIEFDDIVVAPNSTYFVSNATKIAGEPFRANVFICYSSREELAIATICEMHRLQRDLENRLADSLREIRHLLNGAIERINDSARCFKKLKRNNKFLFVNDLVLFCLLTVTAALCIFRIIFS